MTQDTDQRIFTERHRQELAHRRVLVLDGELNDDNGTHLMTQLLTLAADAPDETISLWIHSPGGSVPAMLAIRDILKSLPCAVSTVALGWAASAGQFLLSAGTPGLRYAMPHAKVLLHQGSGGIGGSAVDVELQAEDLRHTRDTTLRLIAEDTGQSPQRVYEDSLRDHWFTAQEALEYGFVDAIVTDFSQIAPPGLRRPTGLTSRLSFPEHTIDTEEQR
ncbi:ClpP family protease [Enteractinococcus helveticum]|uniref:ATP-dependent Clp protease proteolytic subunit n=1 Tax=Enteractinococcus helveticum TaxID=1837282 RepID=A0A1B7LZ52_9MICC|nr:ATP-dependent Clp protease proteolytic subunit [Enteractinococcus helveticum]OAV60661.1 ATP-dependent Clp protease proteolytic subunit [Enteractinococcus helveticum]